MSYYVDFAKKKEKRKNPDGTECHVRSVGLLIDVYSFSLGDAISECSLICVMRPFLKSFVLLLAKREKKQKNILFLICVALRPLALTI